MGENITKKVDDFLIFIQYKCLDNCTFKVKELKKIMKKEFSLITSYSTKLIDNDNPNFPVINAVLKDTYSFYLDDFYGVYPIWEVYNYEEKKGIFQRLYDHFFTDNKNSQTFGKFKEVKDHDFTSDVDGVDIHCDGKNENCIKDVLGILILNPLEGIHLYKRSSISIWDYLANIAALGTTIFNGLCKIFGLLYSKNFDNYKIIENILIKETKKVKKLS